MEWQVNATSQSVLQQRTTNIVYNVHYGFADRIVLYFQCMHASLHGTVGQTQQYGTKLIGVW